MGPLTQPHTNPAKMRIAQVADTLVEAAAAAMDQAGLDLTLTNRMALAGALGRALERVGCERERAARQRRLAQRTAWVQEQGLLTAAETARRLGLTLHELETAQELALIAPVDVPPHLQAASAHYTKESWRYFLPSLVLTAADRASIAHETLLTRIQAAERLGVPPRTFDDLRRVHQLAPVAETREQGGERANRYRADAVDRLALTG